MDEFLTSNNVFSDARQDVNDQISCFRLQSNYYREQSSLACVSEGREGGREEEREN